MLEAVGGGVASQAAGPKGGSGDLEKGVGALKRFQSKVDALLSEFESSPAGSAKVADQTVTRHAFSGSNLAFPEADGLYSQYHRVHRSLVSLSRSLGDQIEMLQIAVRASEVGYDNLEEELRRRFYVIQTRVEEERDRAAAAANESSGKGDSKTDASKNDGSNSEGGTPAGEKRNSADSYGSGDMGGAE
ncbi:hypothetical protein ACIBI4_29455 [Streptomyces sp. NPDC050418]|uniref:hypothetical protein n=1 Tax=Streptomyces sp. NPDC050418 TaxID=3365612 RepID=UPI00379316AB